MTWYEQRKCKEFLKNPQEHFEKTNIVNFDIINKQIRSEKISDKLLKEYQTVQEKKLVNIQKKNARTFCLVPLEQIGLISILKQKRVLDHFKNVNKCDILCDFKYFVNRHWVILIFIYNSNNGGKIQEV